MNVVMKYNAEDVMTPYGIRQTVLDEICTLAEQHCIERIILFGSRSRGDFSRTSDIDLAVQGGNVAAFSADVDEQTSTLLQYDVVDLNRPVQKELLDSIHTDGVIIYEKD